MRGRTRSFVLVAALAVASGGCGTSSKTSVNAPSDPRCSVAATAQPASIGAPGGSGSITVTTARECSWEARSEADWLSVRSGAAGQGDGAIQFAAAGNPAVSERRGVIVVNDRRVEITQAAAQCAFALERPERAVGAEGGRDDVGVSAQAGCAWSAASEAGWITVVGGGSGSGSGRVELQIAANTTAQARSGRVRIAGLMYTVTQAAAGTDPVPPGTSPPAPPGGTPDPTCVVTPSPTALSFPAEGGPGAITLTASNAGCHWSATPGASWITIPGATTGRGSSQLTFVVAANPGSEGRSGTLFAAATAIAITQAGASAPAPPPPPPPPTPTPPPPTPPTSPACQYSVTPLAISVGFAGAAERRVQIDTTDACAWAAVSQVGWIRVTGTSSSNGDATVHLAIDGHLGVSGRVGTVAVATATVTVTQGGILNEEVTLSGTIANLSGSCPNRTFTLGGATWVTNGATDYRGDGSCRDLRNGRNIRVRGRGQSDGTILATRIEGLGDDD